jgi:small subunit ribosomal protein S13
MAEKPEKTEKAAKPEKPEKGAKPEGKEGKPEKGGKPEGKGDKGKDGGKEGKEGDKKSPKKEIGFRSDNPDFKYIVRIANSDLKGEHPVEIALAAVRGIGIRTAGVLADVTGLNRAERIGNLNDEQIGRIEAAVTRMVETVPPWLVNRRKDVETGVDMHIVSTDVEIKLRDDINRMRKMRSYKGVRHEDGQKVRGQRTRSNGRTGLTMGVQKKSVQQAASPKKEEGGKEEKKEAKPAAGGAKPAAGGAKPAAGGAKPAGGAPAGGKK